MIPVLGHSPTWHSRGMAEYWNHNSAYHPWLIPIAAQHCGDVLDVGCGEGLLAQRLAPVLRSVTAADVEHVATVLRSDGDQPRVVGTVVIPVLGHSPTVPGRSCPTRRQSARSGKSLLPDFLRISVAMSGSRDSPDRLRSVGQDRPGTVGEWPSTGITTCLPPIAAQHCGDVLDVGLRRQTAIPGPVAGPEAFTAADVEHVATVLRSDGDQPRVVGTVVIPVLGHSPTVPGRSCPTRRQSARSGKSLLPDIATEIRRKSGSRLLTMCKH